MFRKFVSLLVVLCFCMSPMAFMGCSEATQAKVDQAVNQVVTAATVIAADAQKLFPSAQTLVKVVQANYPTMMELMNQTADPKVQAWLTAADTILTFLAPWVLGNQSVTDTAVKQGLAEGQVLEVLQSGIEQDPALANKMAKFKAKKK